MQRISPRKIGWSLAAALALVVATTLSAGLAVAAPSQQNVSYTVTIENLTSGQPLTPPVVAAHSAQTDVFDVGQPASEELRQVAENGNNDPIMTLLGGSEAVTDVVAGDAPILPGASTTLTIEAPSGSLLSIVSMLICTNDGFTGVDSLSLPASGSVTVDANAYDAGTEENSEASADLVDPCGAAGPVMLPEDGNAHTATSDAIMMHPGIQGSADLTVADHGWTDPVARITVSAEPSGPPSAGGGPLEGGSGSQWAVYLLIGGVVLLVTGGTVLVVGRRAIQ